MLFGKLQSDLGLRQRITIKNVPLQTSHNQGNKGAILSIAGSDPSGGAGIQADLKTFTSIGVYGAAAITCLTAQNSMGMSALLPVEPDFVEQQIRVVLADLQITHIKTGMMGTGLVAAAVARAVQDFTGEIICDPVLKASDGQDLLKPQDMQTWRNQLLTKATVLTPNLPELATITDQVIASEQEAIEAGKSLLKEFPALRSIIITGGHLHEESNQVADFLICKEKGGIQLHSTKHPRIATRNTHGTGCTFASAFSAFHLLGGNDYDAFKKTSEYMDVLLQKSSTIFMGKGKGPLSHHLITTKSG